MDNESLIIVNDMHDNMAKCIENIIDNENRNMENIEKMNIISDDDINS